MARKRLVSPEFFTHADLYTLEMTTGLPVSKAFQGLWCQADRRGLFAWRPVDLRLAIFPYGFGPPSSTMLARCQHCASTVLGQAHVMSDILDALCVAQFVESYAVDGKWYGRIPSFGSWQTFHMAEKPNRLLPEPLTAFPATFSPPPLDDKFRCQHGASTVLAPCQHRASTSVTVAVTGTGTVTGTDILSTSVESSVAHRAPPPDVLPLFGAESAGAAKPRASRKPARTAASRQPVFPHFPKALCDEWHSLWTQRAGAVDYPAFRKAFGPIFVAPENRTAEHPTDAELTAALTSYVDLMPRGQSARFLSAHNAAKVLAAIATVRRDYRDDPSARQTAVMRILHGTEPVRHRRNGDG